MRTMTFLNGILLSFFALAASAHADFTAANFSLKSDVTFHPVALAHGQDDRSFEQPAGTSLAVIGYQTDAQYGRLLHIGLDVDATNNVPSDFWVRATDLSSDSLLPDPSAGGLSDLKAMTYCYKFVKEYLLSIHAVPVYLPGSSAFMAASILPRYGFRHSGRSQYNARNGDVCVYSGGNGNNGHIEVKRSGDWWYGYGFIPHPISLDDHHLIGCFAK